MEAGKEKRSAADRSSRTLVELVGRERLLVEHHRGVLGYSAEEVLVGTDYGRLRIAGKQLTLGCMSREQLFLAGRIDGITAEGRD